MLVFSRSIYFSYWQIPAPPVWLQLLTTFALSYVTWRWVEAPGRKRIGRVQSKARVLMGAVVFLGLLLACSEVLISVAEKSKPFAQTHPRGRFQKIIASNDYAAESWGSTSSLPIGERGQPPSFAVIGDSYAGMWGDTIDRIARAHHVSGLMMSQGQCPFFTWA